MDEEPPIDTFHTERETFTFEEFCCMVAENRCKVGTPGVAMAMLILHVAFTFFAAAVSNAKNPLQIGQISHKILQ